MKHLKSNPSLAKAFEKRLARATADDDLPGKVQEAEGTPGGGEPGQQQVAAAAAGGAVPRKGPSLTNADLAAAGLPPEGTDYHGTVSLIRDLDKGSKFFAAVDIKTDCGIEVSDLLLLMADKPSPMLRESLQRARFYAELSGKQVDYRDWASAKAAMMGARIVFDVVHDLGRDTVVRAKVVNVRPATGA